MKLRSNNDETNSWLRRSVDRLKIAVLCLLLITALIATFSLPYWTELLVPKSYDWIITILNKVPHVAIGTAFLTFLLTQATQIWYNFKKQTGEIYKSLLDPEFIMKGMDISVVMKIFKSSLERITGDDTFSKDFIDIVEKRIISTRDYRHDYRITASIIEKKDPETLIEHFCYRLVARFQYDSTISCTKKEFVVFTDQEKFTKYKNDETTEYRFLTVRRWFDADCDSGLFDVLEMAIDGNKLKKIKSKIIDGLYKIYFEIPKKYNDNVEHRITYVIEEKILKRGHQIFFSVRVPCYGFFCEIDYSQSDIFHMECRDMMASRAIATIQRLPERNPFKIVIDLKNSWAIPGSGVFFTWQRKDERSNDYAAAELIFPRLAEDIKSNL